MKIKYVTGSKNKFDFAKRMLAESGIEIEQIVLDIPEIQGEDYLEIAKDKARKAYEQVGEPLFVTDTAWEVPALNGFPGPYMKSIQKWFGARDWLSLLSNKNDRSVKCIDTIIYIDENEEKIFECILDCVFSESVRAGGETEQNAIHNLIKYDGKYIREYTIDGNSIPGEDVAWKKFADYLNK